MKLLVCDTKRMAEEFGTALDLNAADWRFEGVGFSASGHKFERIVVCLRRTNLSDLELERATDWLRLLRTRMAPGKEINFI